MRRSQTVDSLGVVRISGEAVFDSFAAARARGPCDCWRGSCLSGCSGRTLGWGWGLLNPSKSGKARNASDGDCLVRNDSLSLLHSLKPRTHKIGSTGCLFPSVARAFFRFRAHFLSGGSLHASHAADSRSLRVRFFQGTRAFLLVSCWISPCKPLSPGVGQHPTRRLACPAAKRKSRALQSTCQAWASEM